MFTKIAVTALILILAWLLLFRRPVRRGPRPPAGPSLPHPLHFARCARCGVYRQAGAPCGCDRREDGDDGGAPKG